MAWGSAANPLVGRRNGVLDPVLWHDTVVSLDGDKVKVALFTSFFRPISRLSLYRTFGILRLESSVKVLHISIQQYYQWPWIVSKMLPPKKQDKKTRNLVSFLTIQQSISCHCKQILNELVESHMERKQPEKGQQSQCILSLKYSFLE